MKTQEFLSTPSVRRATLSHPSPLWIAPISIHALREEGDDSGKLIPFYVDISIHALREEGDENLDYSPECSRNFYPRPP